MASAKCWSLLVGSRLLRGPRRTFSPGDDRLIQEITTRHFPNGYTILNAEGGWFDPVSRKFVHEESRQVLICSASPAQVRRWGTELGIALNQKELLVVELGRGVLLKVKV